MAPAKTPPAIRYAELVVLRPRRREAQPNRLDAAAAAIGNAGRVPRVRVREVSVEFVFIEPRVGGGRGARPLGDRVQSPHQREAFALERRSGRFEQRNTGARGSWRSSGGGAAQRSGVLGSTAPGHSGRCVTGGAPQLSQLAQLMAGQVNGARRVATCAAPS